jgi:hypothetical protein
VIPNAPTRRVLAVAAIGVAVALALPRFLTHTPYQRLGAYVSRGVVERVVGPPASGLLKPGDVIVGVGSLDLRVEGARDTLRAHGMPPGPFKLVVLRDGRPVPLMVPPVQMNAWERLRVYAYPLIAIIAAPLVAFLLVWRRPDLATAWVFLWFILLQGLGVMWNLYQYPQVELTRAFKAYLRAYEWIAWLYPASFIHFTSVFPRPRWTARRRRKSVWFWITVAAYVTPVVLWLGWSRTGKGPSEFVYDTYQAIAIAIGIVSLIGRYARSGAGWRPDTHQRVLAFLAAFAVLSAATLNVAALSQRVLMFLPDALQPTIFMSVLVAWLSAPFVFAYLIADDPLFDPRRLIADTLPYALLTTVLAAVYLGLVFLGQRLFARVTGEQTLVFSVVAALVLAFAFAPLWTRVQRGIDRLYGRDPERLRRAFDDAGRSLLSALDPDEVRLAVEGGIVRGLRRPVAVEWPAEGAPKLADPESAPEHARAELRALLRQAGIRLENLRLAAARAAAERAAVELRAAATSAELRALQAQVQPHFLFNALNALAYLIETDPAAAQRFSERLADMLRYTVEAGKRPAALLSDEIAFVEDYLGVARERYENPLEFRYVGDPALLSTAVPPLLLQPLVENSLKHGIHPGGTALHLTLSAARDDGWFQLEFADDGEPHGNGGPSLGTGLENLEQRVRRFAGNEASITAGTQRGDDGTVKGYAVRVRWLAREQEEVA